MRLIAWTFAISICVLTVSGCGSTNAYEDERVSSQRNKYILREEPLGAIGFGEAKKRLEQSDEIVVLGRISAGEHEPWDEGRASFLITDATIEDHGHHHADGHECAFCKGKNDPLETMAIVEILGSDGNVLSIDARDLLGVKKDQLIVVRGRGEVDALGQLNVYADGIYLR